MKKSQSERKKKKAIGMIIFIYPVIVCFYKSNEKMDWWGKTRWEDKTHMPGAEEKITFTYSIVEMVQEQLSHVKI